MANPPSKTGPPLPPSILANISGEGVARGRGESGAVGEGGREAKGQGGGGAASPAAHMGQGAHQRGADA